jgi:hypothetical protein
MAITRIKEDIIGHACFFCGSMLHKLPAIKVNGGNDQIILLHPHCGLKLLLLLGQDCFQLDEKGNLSKHHLETKGMGNNRMLNTYGR